MLVLPAIGLNLSPSLHSCELENPRREHLDKTQLLPRGAKYLHCFQATHICEFYRSFLHAEHKHETSIRQVWPQRRGGFPAFNYDNDFKYF